MTYRRSRSVYNNSMNQKEREECRMRASIATTMQEEEREGGKKESKTFSPRKMVVISRVEV